MDGRGRGGVDRDEASARQGIRGRLENLTYCSPYITVATESDPPSSVIYQSFSEPLSI
jgi:hypothetical protein